MCHDDISEGGIEGREGEGQKQTTKKPQNPKKPLNVDCNTCMIASVGVGHY